MKNLKLIGLAGFLFLFPFYAAIAQGASSEMDALFSATDKKEHKSYMLKYSNTESSYFWIQNDSLYSTRFLTGRKIALTDINFNKKNITKTNMLVDKTQDYVYQLTLEPTTGKPMFKFSSLGYMFISEATPEPGAILKLDMINKQEAEDAFSYLQQLSSGLKNSSGAPEDPFKQAGQNNSGNKTGDFDSRLSSLVMGIKDNFASLMGKEDKDNQFISKVQLDGALSTKVYIGMLHNVYLIADFGDFNTMPEAEAMYNKMSAKIQAAKFPLTMVQMKEMVFPIGKTMAWIPFGADDPDMKEFSVTLELIKTISFDKDNKKFDIYSVSLRIEKL
ncbi:MAG TPA: hypothetical protein VK484_06430 [Ferruginibacter sp.]|nr:hypothetical protein [Ferruginibacter sp.]